MPNWFHNDMKITGAPEELARFKQACIRVVFERQPAQLDFDALIPMPETVRKLPEYEGARIDWATKNWGTRYACHFRVIEDKHDVYEVVFTTPWAPPEPVYLKIAEIFPDLEIHVEGNEPVNNVAYQATFKDGKIEFRQVPLVWSTLDPDTGLVVSGTCEQIERLPGVVRRVFYRPALEGEITELAERSERIE
jgi:hypothetical protein